nr:hypothetical protein [uncultured Flavobacterium sp.]
MKKILILVLLISTSVISQNTNDEINLLVNKINKFNTSILSLKDSIKKIELNIEKLKSKEVLKTIKDSSIVSIALKDGSLKKEPLVGSDIILILDKDSDVLVTDYINGYFKVCVNSLCGYLNEMWIKENQEVSRLKDIRIIEKEKLLNLKEQKRVSQVNKNNKEQESLNLKKYGKTIYDKLKKGYYWIGMTEKMALISLGKPNDINSTVGSWGTHEQWVYDDGFYCYFENGILKSYQN